VAIAFAVITGGITSTAMYFKAERNRAEAELGRENLRKSYSRSDEQMARQRMDNGQNDDAVAYLARSLRTDPANDIAATNLLSLLANIHLIRPDTPALNLPEGADEASKVAISREAGVVVAVCEFTPKSMPAPVREAPQREVISIWKLKTGERTDHPMPPGVLVTCLEVTPDGMSAVIGRDDGGVELWSLKDGKRRNLQPRMPSMVTCIAFSGNGEKLLVGSEIGTDGMGGVQAWDLRQPQDPARVMKQKGGVVSEIAVDYEGIFAASIFGGDPINAAGADGSATTWDLRLGQPVGDPIEVEKGLLHVAIEPKQEIIALGMSNGLVFVGNFRNGGEVLPPLSHPSSITALSFSTDAKSIIVGDGAGYIYDWKLEDGKLRFPSRSHGSEMLVATTVRDTSLVIGVAKEGNVSIFDSKTGALQRARLQRTLRDAETSHDGSLLAFAPRGIAAVQVWNINERMSGRRFVDVLEKNLIARLKGPDNSPNQLRDSEAGGANRQKSLYAAADPDGTVFIYDAKTLKPIGDPFYHPPAVGAVTLTMDEKLLITSGRDREVRVWDLQTRENIVRMRHDSFVSVIALSPDDERLVTITDDGELRVWNFRTGDCLTPAIRDTPRDSLEQEGIVVARVSDDGKSLLFRVSEHGFFTVPMPPKDTRLPEWFLRLAEGLGRRHLTEEGRLESLTLEDFEQRAAAIPKTPAPGEEVTTLWAKWMLAPSATRPLSPFDEQPFNEYLLSLKDNGTPAAAREYLRYRPTDRDAMNRAAKFVPPPPK
jgi:WD40 repeat protein